MKQNDHSPNALRVPRTFIRTALACVLGTFTLAAQDFRITSVGLDADGKLRLTYDGDTNHYYLVLQGDHATNVSTPVSLLSGATNHEYTDPFPAALTPQSFFRLRQLPLTGVVGSADTPGLAVDLCVTRSNVFVADSAAGIAVLDRSSPYAPKLLQQIATPGTAQAVAYSPNMLAVALGDTGAAIIDLPPQFPGDPVVRGIAASYLGGGTVQAVAAAADLAFFGTTAGNVCMVHLASGAVLQSTNLAGRVEDLAIEGATLYAYANGRIHCIPFGGGFMQPTGSVACPGTVNTSNGRGRLFVGRGVAYAVHRAGYNTFDVQNPASPLLLAAGSTSQQGWKQIVLNGGGTNSAGLAAVGQNLAFTGPQNAALYGTSDPFVTDNLLDEFPVTGVARAVAIFNGIGYAACHSNGLQVIQYLPINPGTNPPSGILASSSPDGTIMEGSFVVLRADAADDVQVREVEFYVNGQLALVDGSFPFELVYRVPYGDADKTATFTATIVDTAGHRASTPPLPLLVTPDVYTPYALIDSPASDAAFAQFDDIPVRLIVSEGFVLAGATFQVDGTNVTARRVGYLDWVISGDIPFGPHQLRAIVQHYAGFSVTTLPVSIFIQQQAITAEVSVFNLGLFDPNDIVSREFTVFNLGPKNPQGLTAQVTVFNQGRTTVHNEVLTREVTFFNAGTNTVWNEALSREVSVRNAP